MYINVNNIDEYIEQSYDPNLLVEIVKLISERFPNEKPRYFDNGKTFSAIVFGKNPVPTQGYEEAGIINIASQKNNISIYFYSFFDGKNLFDKYAALFPKSAVGKGCLRIKNKKFLEKYEEAITQFVEEIT
ncbi:hypothetical protein [Lactococcus formosensis]|uniref:hypothetical protein n=1 Tax=Lactococcus formosensis TaxID=1281486 RepID=UPI001BD0BC09|nr:hypothetical protein [Lactococcus formosensis]